MIYLSHFGIVLMGYMDVSQEVTDKQGLIDIQLAVNCDMQLIYMWLFQWKINMRGFLCIFFKGHKKTQASTYQHKHEEEISSCFSMLIEKLLLLDNE